MVIRQAGIGKSTDKKELEKNFHKTLLLMDFASLHELLRSTYDEMMPLCAQMTGIAKGIAGLGALFYIALRVWASIARAEAIDVFPLLRPFRAGILYHVLPDSRTGYDECRSLARECTGNRR